MTAGWNSQAQLPILYAVLQRCQCTHQLSWIIQNLQCILPACVMPQMESSTASLPFSPTPCTFDAPPPLPRRPKPPLTHPDNSRADSVTQQGKHLQQLLPEAAD